MLVSFSAELSPECHRDVLRLTNLLLSDNRPFVRNVHPAYTTVLVSFDPMAVSFNVAEEYVRSSLEKADELTLPPPRTMTIPVCYGGDFGPDLDGVASHNNLSTEEVIRIHSSAEYTVYFLGFSPGFPYMGGMPENIATPRLPNPRTKTPVGSVAIGGRQTGIYPTNTPGGWRIIGRTPLKLFRPDESQPTFLLMGDQVRFDPVSAKEFQELV